MSNDTFNIKRKLGIIKEQQKDYITLNEKGGLINPNQLNRNFNLVNEATGLHVTPHMMRHFFTTQSIIAGVPLEQLSQALGHTKIYMTDRYNQVEDNSLKRLQTYFLVIFAKKSPTIPRPNSKNYRNLSENDV